MKHQPHATLFYLRGENSRYPLSSGPCAHQGRSELCGGKKNLLALSEIEPLFLAKLPYILFAVLSHFHHKLGQQKLIVMSQCCGIITLMLFITSPVHSLMK
jgi:hypothetical protein